MRALMCLLRQVVASRLTRIGALAAGLALLVGVSPIIAQDEGSTCIPRPRLNASLCAQIAYGADSEVDQRQLDLYRPEGNRSTGVTVLMFEDPEADALDYDELNQLFLVHGYAVVRVVQRAEASLPEQVADLYCAVGWLRAQARTYDVQPRRIFALGRAASALPLGITALRGASGIEAAETLAAESIGDTVSSTCPYRTDAAPLFTGVILFSPPAGPAAVPQLIQLPPDWTPTQEAQHDLGQLAAGVNMMGADGEAIDVPPFLLVHGADDQVIPLAQSSRIRSALEAGGYSVMLHTVRRGGHNPRTWSDRVYLDMLGVILQFIESLAPDYDLI
ncbi:MAG: alpha/beta hydrolase [Chloroflexota bacterium]